MNLRESKGTVKKYVDYKHMSFPVLLDTRGEVAGTYGIRGTPAHLLIDKKGDIKAFAPGFKNINNKESRTLIQFLIDQ